MKKIFTLLALLVTFVGGVSAQTTLFDASDAGWVAEGINLTTGTTTVGDVTWYGRGSAAIAEGNKTFGDEVEWTARLKFGGKSTFQSGKTLAGVFTFTPTDAGTVKVYGQGGGAGNRTFYISQSITGTALDTSTSLGSFSSTDSSPGIAEATVEPNKIVYVWADNNVGIYAITFTPATEPIISVADASITATESGVAVTEDIAVRGTNLTGSTLTATLSPEVSGLSVSLGSSTITDGTIETTATLSYTATENASGTTTLILSDGTTSKEVTITYSANVAQHTLQAVSETTTWNWSKISAITTSDLYNNGIQLTAESTPSKNDEFVLEDYNGTLYTTGEGFDGTTVAFKGEYPIRRNEFCQNGIVKIKTTVPGTLVVKFSDTGSSASASAVKRYLQINGENTDYWASRENNGTENPYAAQLNVVTEPINVAAGEITISGSSAIIIYYITFTPSTTESVPVNQYGKGTYVTTNALDFTGITTVTAYVATAQNGSDVTFDPVTKVPAGTPLLVKGETTNVPVIASAEAPAVNLLVKGENAAVLSEAGGKFNFILNYKDGAVGFYRAAGMTVAADRAYLSLSENISAAKVNVIFSDETTGINNVNVNDNDNVKIFNLAGQQMKSAVKGVYIKNGKKYVK